MALASRADLGRTAEGWANLRPQPRRRAVLSSRMVGIRLTPAEYDRVMLLRGDLSAPEYIRRLIAADDVKRREERRERRAAGGRTSEAGHPQCAVDEPASAPAQPADG